MLLFLKAISLNQDGVELQLYPVLRYRQTPSPQISIAHAKGMSINLLFWRRFMKFGDFENVRIIANAIYMFLYIEYKDNDFSIIEKYLLNKMGYFNIRTVLKFLSLQDKNRILNAFCVNRTHYTLFKFSNTFIFYLFLLF